MDGDSAARKIRIGHAEREDVIETLRVAAGDGRLTVEELTERMQQAADAKTYADLDLLVDDLPVPPPSSALGGAAGTVARTTSGAVVPARDAVGWDLGSPLVLRAGWEDEKRRGRWEVPPFIRVESTGATVELNFLEVETTPEVVHIDVAGAMGTCLIVVPDGWGVDIDDVRASWGSKKSVVDHVPRPGHPHIKVRGSLGMSTLSARYANWFDKRRLEKRP